MIEFSGAFNPDTREWVCTLDDGRGDQLAYASHPDPAMAVQLAFDEVRWTPVVTVDTQGKFL